MKQRKREYLILYSYYDRTGITEHLKDMAAKGWMLEKIGSGGWQYRWMEPKQLRFSIVYFPKASQFDPGPSAHLETFRDLCAEAGWILAADSGQIQVFYNEDPNAVPIETDASVQLTNLHKAMKNSFLRSYWTLLAFSLFEIVFSVWQLWQDPVGHLSSPMNLVSNMSYFPLLLLVAAELARYYCWHRRAKTAAEAGAPLPELRSARKLNLSVLVLAVLELLLLFSFSFLTSHGMTVTMLLVFLYMGLMFLLVYAATSIMKRLRFSAWSNRIVSVVILTILAVGMMAGLTALVFRMSGSGWMDARQPAETYEAHGMTWNVYHDDIPLRIEDLLEVDYDEWSTEMQRDESFLLSHTEYQQQARLDAPRDIPDLDYEIVDVKAGFLYDLCKWDFITKYWYNHPEEYRDNYLPIDAAPWGAEEVYQRHNYDGTPSNYFLICWPDRLVEIHFYWAPTPEQVAIAAEILKTA